MVCAVCPHDAHHTPCPVDDCGCLAKPPKGACRNCGAPCTSRDSRIYCSRACAFAVGSRKAEERRLREAKPCVRCGARLTVRSRGRVLASKYCSQACQRQALRDRATARRARRTKACPHCGVTFTPSWVGRTWQKFCSAKCAREATAAKRFVVVTCCACGAQRTRPRAEVRRAKRQFCSVACRQKWTVGTNHPQFRGRTNHKTGAWQRLARAIRQRDEHTCRRCRAVRCAGERAFPVDHIYPRRAFARVEDADAPVNLVTVCHACHTRKTFGAEAAWLTGDVLAFERYKREVLNPEQLAALAAHVAAAGMDENYGVQQKAVPERLAAMDI